MATRYPTRSSSATMLSVCAVVWYAVFAEAFSSVPAAQQRGVLPSAQSHRMLVRRYGLSQGWDNNNFLESLGQGQDAIEEANTEYWKHNESNERMRGWKADMQAKQKEKERLQKDGDNPTGGTRFREMMEKAKKQQQQRPPPNTNTPPPQTMQQPPQYQQPQQLYDQHGNPVQLPPMQYYDKDGNPVTVYPVPPQQPAQQPQYTPPQTPSHPVPQPRNDGRKVGRNKDADAITNTADVYFAQLKQDSTIRTTARQAGDIDTANQAMAHPDIEKMKDMIHTNPYLQAEIAERERAEEEARKKVMSMIETSDDEMINAQFQSDNNEDNVDPQQQIQSTMGNYQSFKDKLRAAQAKRNRRDFPGGGQM